MCSTLVYTGSFSPAATSYIHSGVTRHGFSREPPNGIVWVMDAENHYSELFPFLFQFSALFVKIGLLWWMNKGLACFLPWQLVSLAKARGDGPCEAWWAEAAWEWIYNSKGCCGFPHPWPTSGVTCHCPSFSVLSIESISLEFDSLAGKAWDWGSLGCGFASVI